MPAPRRTITIAVGTSPESARRNIAAEPVGSADLAISVSRSYTDSTIDDRFILHTGTSAQRDAFTEADPGDRWLVTSGSDTNTLWERVNDRWYFVPYGTSVGAVQKTLAIPSVGSAFVGGLCHKSVGAGMAVAVLADGLVPADANRANHAGRVVGVARTSGEPGAKIDYVISGPLDVPINLPPGSFAYVGRVPGQLVAAPEPGSAFLQQLGIVGSTGALSVTLGLPILR